jgi:broad specificity phosphatase PhoE
MTTYYIFRHGNTKNTEGIGSLKHLTTNGGGPVNLPILPKSKYALENIGKYLVKIPTDANFTSPYLRCQESSKIVSNVSEKKFIVDGRIRELTRSISGFAGFKSRVKEFLEEIETKKYSSVLICTHGAVIAAIKHLVTRGKFNYFQGMDFPPPGNLMIIKGKKVEIINFNKI